MDIDFLSQNPKSNVATTEAEMMETPLDVLSRAASMVETNEARGWSLCCFYMFSLPLAKMHDKQFVY